ncbi:hypothetical protein EGI22_20015 [Lacihabitans sp. LS3-19]|uniref:hypothetical protein n=1 Tax=Lacihabitans sp. LS3-19 TaxID=2487335 RepID=UPI0020CC2300|nr:hypothetical protein [Lacihabitans sp. LS3-19]MCP9770197.1 hypothetical protein [Lacihabitans sp. LS3-19]
MNLPEYEPSDKIWQNIEAKLNEDALRQALKSLPEYEPKDELWQKVSSKLNKSNFGYVKWVAAASIIIFISVYFSQKNNEIKYTKQQIEPELLLSENDLSEYGYEEIMKICNEDKIVCEKPEFKALETELEELNTASTELKEAIGKYNTEPELITQLAQIENQKSDIIRKMAAQI